MKRKLTPSECLFLSNSSTAFQILVQVELEERLSVETLQFLLARLQQTLPSVFVRVEQEVLRAGIASEVRIDTVMVPSVHISAAETMQWLHEQVQSVWDLRDEAPLRVLLLDSPQRSLLALLFHHGICDGKTVALALEELLSALNHAELPQRPTMPEQVLPLSLEDLFELPIPDDFTARLMMPHADRQLVQPRLGLDQRRWSPEQTQTLLAACRAHGFTLHAALCAAASRSLHSLVETRQQGVDPQSLAHYHVHFPINVRDKLGLSSPATGNLILFASI